MAINVIDIFIGGFTEEQYIKNINLRYGIKTTPKELQLFMHSDMNVSNNKKFAPLIDEVKRRLKDFDGTSIQNVLSPTLVLKTDYISILWKKNKTIYVLDEDFKKDLQETNIDKIPISIFKQLPYNQMLIKMGNKKWALIDVYIKFGYITITAIYIIGGSIELYEKCFSIKSEFIKPNMFSNYQDLDRLLYQFLMYISQPYSSDIVKIEESNIPLDERPKYKQYKNCNAWNVGFRYGNAIRNNSTNKVRTSINYYKTHNSPKSHIRKAHWHTYKVGPGRKETIVKWVAPILVNAKDESEIIYTAHKVTN